MPSDRKQINVRVDDETAALVRELIPVVSAAIGLQVSQSDLFRLGLVELRKKYKPVAAVAPPEGRAEWDGRRLPTRPAPVPVVIERPTPPDELLVLAEALKEGADGAAKMAAADCFRERGYADLADTVARYVNEPMPRDVARNIQDQINHIMYAARMAAAADARLKQVDDAIKNRPGGKVKKKM